jgi:hypothetical protein
VGFVCIQASLFFSGWGAYHYDQYGAIIGFDPYLSPTLTQSILILGILLGLVGFIIAVIALLRRSPT